MNFRELVRHMAIDDSTMVRHLDALLRDFVDDHRALFGFFGDQSPAESVMSKAGWRWFAAGHLRIEQDDGLLPRLELAGDLAGRGDAKSENQRLVALYERLRDVLRVEHEARVEPASIGAAGAGNGS
jgi:hypothetical protein